MKKTNIAIICIMLLSFAISIYLYPMMPDNMASHWGASGQVNGYMPKFWALFLMPMISVVILALLWAIPKLDPLKKNVEKFRSYFDLFILLLMIFMFYIHLLTISWNIGIRFDMIQLLAPAFCVLFYYAGVMMENSRMNWFIGIRTPWTLSSENVWNKTNRLGGKLFKIAGILSLIALLPFSHGYTIFFIIVPVLIFSLYIVAYSYLEYKKENKGGKKR
ncbi:MAG: SdpI family protein [Candidatus Woesearchaeota archaeon]|nr:SdpI family protein [Candidatus Woesearchaeota archaeon]